MRVQQAHQFDLMHFLWFPGVSWRGPECWPGLWVSFQPTWYNPSHHHSLQYLTLTWHHCLGWRMDWVTRFYRPLVVLSLNLFCRSQWPLVCQDLWRRVWWDLGTHGRCRSTPVGQASRILLGGSWMRIPVHLGARRPGWWTGRWSGRHLGPPRWFNSRW